MNKTNRITPSNTSILSGVITNANNMSIKYRTSIAGKSYFLTSFPIAVGIMSALKPEISRVLNIFEPITLPKLKSFKPFIEPIKLTEASGAEVPIETRVQPITSGGIFKARAILHEPSTNKSAPFTSKIMPETSKMQVITIV